MRNVLHRIGLYLFDAASRRLEARIMSVKDDINAKLAALTVTVQTISSNVDALIAKVNSALPETDAQAIDTQLATLQTELQTIADKSSPVA